MTLSVTDAYNGEVTVGVECQDHDFGSNGSFDVKHDFIGGFETKFSDILAGAGTIERSWHLGDKCLLSANFEFQVSCDDGFVNPLCRNCASCDAASQYASVPCEPPIDAQCEACHPECSGGCTGGSNEQCMSCKNAQDGPSCIAQCGSDKFLDGAKTCQTCNLRGRCFREVVVCGG